MLASGACKSTVSVSDASPTENLDSNWESSTFLTVLCWRGEVSEDLKNLLTLPKTDEGVSVGGVGRFKSGVAPCSKSLTTSLPLPLSLISSLLISVLLLSSLGWQ